MEFKKCHISDKRFGDPDETEQDITEYEGMIESSVNEVNTYLALYAKYQEAKQKKAERQFIQANNADEL